MLFRSVEFKRDERDGRLKFIEVNARAGFWAPLATAAGVNLSYIAYRDAVGRPLCTHRQRDGVRWIDVLRDGPDSLRELWQGELRFCAWMAPLIGVRADAYWSLRDPLPGMQESSRLGLRALKRGLLPST